MLNKTPYAIIKAVPSQKKMQTQMEHRKNIRLTCHVPVDGQNGSIFGESLTVDISSGGIGFITKQPIPVDEKIAVEIELSPKEDPVILMGRVLWVQQIGHSDKYRIGMKFGDNVLEGAQDRLKQYFGS